MFVRLLAELRGSIGIGLLDLGGDGNSALRHPAEHVFEPQAVAARRGGSQSARLARISKVKSIFSATRSAPMTARNGVRPSCWWLRVK